MIIGSLPIICESKSGAKKEKWFGSEKHYKSWKRSNEKSAEMLPFNKDRSLYNDKGFTTKGAMIGGALGAGLTGLVLGGPSLALFQGLAGATGGYIGSKLSQNYNKKLFQKYDKYGWDR